MRSSTRAKRGVQIENHDQSRVSAGTMNFMQASYQFELIIARQECQPTEFFQGSCPVHQEFKEVLSKAAHFHTYLFLFRSEVGGECALLVQSKVARMRLSSKVLQTLNWSLSVHFPPNSQKLSINQAMSFASSCQPVLAYYIDINLEIILLQQVNSFDLACLFTN